MSMLDIVTAVLVLSGSTLALTAAVGIVRFPDTLSRMHAATKSLACCWCSPGRRSGFVAMWMSAC